MRVFGLDFETSGLDTARDRITEVGFALWDVPEKQPITAVGAYLYDETYPNLSPEIVRLTGITDSILKEFGQNPARILGDMDLFCERHSVGYIVAHNGGAFDKLILLSELDRHSLPAPRLRGLPWIDTKYDLPFASEPDSRRLKHLAGDHGFLNPFSHRAMFDVLTMLRIMSHYDFDAILDYMAQPWIVIRAVVPHPRQDNGAGKDKAKAAGYRWQDLDGEKFELCWVKRIKAHQLEEEKKKLPGITIVQLR